jgi:endonuclease/exonuclease/phosphatase family metal-dependent hydrolase
VKHLRVMTWNILEGGRDGRLEDIIRLIRAQRPQIVALQECNDWHYRGDKLLRYVAGKLEMQAFPHWTTSGYQPALLTSLEGARAIPHDDQDHFNLGYQEVVLPIPGGRNWHFFNLHFDPFSERQRISEVKTVLRAAKRHRDGWASITGDFNSVAPGDTYRGTKLKNTTRIDLDAHEGWRPWFDFACNAGTIGWPPDPSRRFPGIPYRERRAVRYTYILTQVYRSIRAQGWVDAFRRMHPRDPGWTVPTQTPYARIDFAFLSGQLSRRLKRIEVLYGPQIAKASDHCPLVWEVDVS